MIHQEGILEKRGLSQRIQHYEESEKNLLAEIAEKQLRLKKIQATLDTTLSENKKLVESLEQQLASQRHVKQIVRGNLKRKEDENAKLQKQLETVEIQAAQFDALAQQRAQALAQMQESRERMRSLLAMFSASKTTGWEATFIATITEELHKN
jgi:chromosome segregation ATPase